MNVWAPEQMHKLGFRHREEYVKDREAMRGMTYDQEVTTIWYGIDDSASCGISLWSSL